MDFFEKIDAQLAKKLPFVVYRKPGEARIKSIFQKDNELHFLKDYQETGFVFAPFQTENPTILLRPDQVWEHSNFSSQALKSHSKIYNKIGEEQKQFHIDLVNKGIAKITSGLFDKVILSRVLKAEGEVAPLSLFKELLAHYSSAFCYLWYHPKVGMWLGATPEILLLVRNQQFSTMSLAGTQPYSGKVDPPWGSKELEEQEMVTNFIMDALEGKVSNLVRTPVESVKAGNLMHLRTKISGRLKKDHLGVVLEALHPTSAVCGIPKNSSKAFILENENYDREFYTGYLGELNFKTEKHRNSRTANQENQVYRSVAHTSALFVNLRCMQLKNGTPHIYVGGGITKDSDPEREWEETVSKSETMLRIL